MTFFQKVKIKKLEKNKMKLNKIQEIKKKKLDIVKLKCDILKIKDGTKDVIIETELTKEFNNFKKYKIYNFSKKGFFKKMVAMVVNAPKIMAKIELLTGEYDTIVISFDRPFFIYNKKAYIIDDSLKLWDKRAKMFFLSYHENCSLPIRIKIPLNQLNSKLESSEISDIELSANPSVLRRFIESEFVEKIMKGADIGKDLGMIKMLGVLTVIGVACCMILLLKDAL